MAKFRLTREVSMETYNYDQNNQGVTLTFPKGFVFEGEESGKKWKSVTFTLPTNYGDLRPTFLDYEYEYVNQAPLYLRERKIVAVPTSPVGR